MNISKDYSKAFAEVAKYSILDKIDYCVKNYLWTTVNPLNKLNLKLSNDTNLWVTHSRYYLANNLCYFFSSFTFLYDLCPLIDRRSCIFVKKKISRKIKRYILSLWFEVNCDYNSQNRVLATFVLFDKEKNSSSYLEVKKLIHCSAQSLNYKHNWQLNESGIRMRAAGRLRRPVFVPTVSLQGRIKVRSGGMACPLKLFVSSSTSRLYIRQVSAISNNI